MLLLNRNISIGLRQKLVSELYSNPNIVSVFGFFQSHQRESSLMKLSDDVMLCLYVCLRLRHFYPMLFENSR